MTELAREARWLSAGEAERIRALANRSEGLGWTGTVLPLSSLSLVAYAVHIGDPVVRAFCGVVGITGALLAFVLLFARRDDRQKDGYNALRMEFPSDCGMLVSLIVRQGDAPTGEDVGLLWFEEGRLYFSGRRTSFGLVSGQARTVSGVREGVRGIRNAVDLTLRRDTAAGTMALSFEPVLPPHEGRDVHRTALRAELAGWLGVVSGGEGQFPPTILGPGVVAQGRLLRDALAATLPIPVLLSILFHYTYPPLALTAFGLALFVIVGAVPASNLRWRAWRDRRRLR